MSGRPAGYSDEDNDDEYNFYDDDASNSNIGCDYGSRNGGLTGTDDNLKDPWLAIADNIVSTSSTACDKMPDSNQPDFDDDDSPKAFLKYLQEGNVDKLKEIWFKPGASVKRNDYGVAKNANPSNGVSSISYINYSFNELGGSRPIFVACSSGHPRSS